jgi:hypothetical protein
MIRIRSNGQNNISYPANSLYLLGMKAGVFIAQQSLPSHRYSHPGPVGRQKYFRNKF